MFKPEQLLALFVAGGIGTLSRFGLTTFLARFFVKGAPWSVAAINVVGCLAFGVFAALFAARTSWSAETKTVVLTGFFGAFTTFSTYLFEIYSASKSGDFVRAVGSFVLQNGLGFAAIALGFFLARRLFAA